MIMGELLGWVMTDGQQTYGDSRWLLMCDAGPRGLLPRCHLPWQHTGTVTFATWWEILQFDGLVYMLRGVFAVRRLIILRNLFAVVRLACRGLCLVNPLVCRWAWTHGQFELLLRSRTSRQLLCIGTRCT